MDLPQISEFAGVGVVLVFVVGGCFLFFVCVCLLVLCPRVCHCIHPTPPPISLFLMRRTEIGERSFAYSKTKWFLFWLCTQCDLGKSPKTLCAPGIKNSVISVLKTVDQHLINLRNNNNNTLLIKCKV